MFFGNSSLSLLDDYIVGNKVTPLSVLLCEICAAAEERTSERASANRFIEEEIWHDPAPRLLVPLLA